MKNLIDFKYLAQFILGIIIIVGLSSFSCSVLMLTDSVKGTITDADTAQPIEGVLVTVETVYSPSQYTTTTDTNGYYEINNIISGGGLVLKAEKEGYITINDGFDVGNHTKDYQMVKTN